MKIHRLLRPATLATLLAAAPVFAAEPAQPPPSKPDAWAAPEARTAVFDQVTRELDENGEAIFFWNTQDIMREMMRNVRESVAAMPEPDLKAKTAEVAQKAEQFLDAQGFYSVRGLGFSSAPDGKGNFVHKAFLARDPAAASAPLWQCFGGEPRVLKSLAFQPKDTAFLFATNSDLKALRGMIHEGVRQFGGEEALKEMDASLAGMKDRGGLDLEALLAATGDEAFVSFQLSSGKTASLPIPGMKVSIPHPSLVIGIALRDPAAAEACLKAFLAKTPELTPSTVGGQTMYLAKKQEMPANSVDFQPVVSIQQGFLFIASCPAALQAALDSAKNKDGFTTTAEYKKAFSGMPEKVNGVGYLSPRLTQAALAFLKTAMMAEKNGDESTKEKIESAFAKIQQMASVCNGAAVRVNKPGGILVIKSTPMSARQSITTPLAGFFGIGVLQSSKGATGNIRCRNNLRQISLACKLYANDNDGLLPPSLDALIKGQCLTDSAIFACPDRQHADGGNHMDYDYFGAGHQDIDINSTTVLIADRAGNHPGMFTAVFGDCHVEVLKGATLEEALKMYRGYKLPPGAKPTAAPALAPAPKPAAVVAVPTPQAPPADWAAKPACAAQYQQAMKELDRNGELLCFFNTKDLVKNLMFDIRGLITPLQLPEENGIKPAELLATIDGFLKDAGIYTVNGVGYSSCPRQDGLFVQKMFLSHAPADANAPLWKMIGGAPRTLRCTGFLPKDTALAEAFTFDMKTLWSLIRDGVEKFGGADAMASMDEFLEDAKTNGGMDLEGFIAATGEELFVSIQFPESDGDSGAAATFAVGIAVRDAAAAETCIHNALDKLPGKFTSTTVDNVTVYTLAEPINNVPFAMQPSFSIRDGFLLAASTPAALQAMIDAAKNKNGLATTAGYKKAFAGLPEKVNGIVYVSPRFMKKYMEFCRMLVGNNNGMEANTQRVVEGWMTKIMGNNAGASVVVNKPDGLLTISVSGQNIHNMLATMPGMYIPLVMQIFGHTRNQTCISNLRQIDRAVHAWCGMNNSEKIPTWDQLVVPGDPMNSYLKTVPKCPSGGTYTLPKSLMDSPTCSCPGHVMP